MQLQISEAAVERLKPHMGNQLDHAFHLIYDTEGCGCAVNGVPTLKWLPNNHDIHKKYISISEFPIPVRITENDAVFFEEKMYLDFTSSNLCYRLSGPGQIYHGCMNVK
jgi:uncharacterized protein YqkB